ncbi:hypothetical protein SSX86_023608 [Deinandra increscens subsp. villosa]|uniref:DC1 domain-containing protein n=1 Tax=Deinandra increscens subsp. villosa TaxID=3103831 RepID=A0AAP0CL62_9ASTR
MMKVLEHEHPLKLVDLRVINNEESDDFVEEEDEEEDLVPKYEFVRSCNRCHQEINEYYRYYYKCSLDDDSCDFFLHNFCAELPTTLHDNASHPHPLTLRKIRYKWECKYCKREHGENEVGYLCLDSKCSLWGEPSWFIDVICGMEGKKRRIHHPSHPHPMVCLISYHILCKCNACGKEHKGVFFQCTTCSNFVIHTDCAFLPKTLLIQHTTNEVFHHTHPLTLSYSFPIEEQIAKYYPRCRVCDGGFYNHKNLWIYKCEKCIYYAHLDCATSRKEHFMSMLSSARGRTVKNFKDADYPDLLCLPFPDPTYGILKHLFFKETEPAINDECETETHSEIFSGAIYKFLNVKFGSIHKTNGHSHPLSFTQGIESDGECSMCLEPLRYRMIFKCLECKFAIDVWCCERMEKS